MSFCKYVCYELILIYIDKAIHECSSSIQEREAAIDEFYKVLKKTKDGVAYGVHLLAEKIADSPEQESLEALDVSY